MSWISFELLIIIRPVVLTNNRDVPAITSENKGRMMSLPK
jgi:hypothetical protein